MGNHSLPMLMTIVVVFMVGMMTSLAEAQTADCAQKLVPCASFINDTNPPDSCCNPIKEAVATQLPCLCGLYTTPGVLKSFGITVEQALNLTRNCGINSDISKCNGIFFFFFSFFFLLLVLIYELQPVWLKFLGLVHLFHIKLKKIKS